MADFNQDARDVMNRTSLPDSIPDPSPPPPQPPCVRQRISLFDLPAELRNRLYEEILPSSDRGDKLLIASPHWDTLMQTGVQPPLLCTNRQVRSETIKMFYASNTLHAYISYSDFRPLFRFLRTIPPGRKLKIELNMLHHLSCYTGLIDLARAWQQINFAGIQITIRSAFIDPAPGKRQCQAIAAAINLGEAQSGDDYLSGARWEACLMTLQKGRQFVQISCDGLNLDKRLCSENIRV